MLETLKAHPYIVAAVGIGGVIFLYLLSSGGSTTAVATPTAADSVATGTAAQSDNSAAQLAAYDTGAQTQVSLAQITAQNNLDIATINAGVSLANIDASKQVAIQTNTLEAQVQEGQQAEQATALADQVQQNKDTLGVLSQQITANQAVSTASINASSKAANGHPILDLIGNVLSHIF